MTNGKCWYCHGTKGWGTLTLSLSMLKRGRGFASRQPYNHLHRSAYLATTSPLHHVNRLHSTHQHIHLWEATTKSVLLSAESEFSEHGFRKQRSQREEKKNIQLVSLCPREEEKNNNKPLGMASIVFLLLSRLASPGDEEHV